MTRNDTPEFIL